ncbi:MAG: hypothetical protein QHJ73_17840, partial [Armatimonadota bacterium]|nr:hypothetical protein [Armatimonadota bacterium]
LVPEATAEETPEAGQEPVSKAPAFPVPPAAGLWRLAVVCWLFALGGLAAAHQARLASQAPPPPEPLPMRIGEWQRSSPAKIEGSPEFGEWKCASTYRHPTGRECVVLVHMPFAQRRRLARPINFYLKLGRELVEMKTVNLGTRRDPRLARMATFTKGKERIVTIVSYLRRGWVTDSYVMARLRRSAEQLLRGRPHVWASASVSAGDPDSVLALMPDVLPIAEEWVTRAEEALAAGSTAAHPADRASAGH